MEQTLSSYYIFYTVATCGNISRAALKLFISQPAVSKSIQKLEESLGCRLFVRSSRGVVLTDEGSLLYTHVKAAMDSLNAGEEKIRRSIDMGVGHLKIGVSSTLCKYVLLPYLKKFTEKNPHINISIRCQSTSDTLRLLEENKLDIGLVGKNDHIRALNFDYLCDVEDIFVATKQYVHNLRQRGISEQRILENASLMLLDKDNITRHYIDDYLFRHQITAEECIEVSSMDLLIEFAKIHLGVAAVIRQFVEPELADGTLVEIPLPDKLMPRSLGFVYKPQACISKALDKFIRFYHD